MCVTNGGATSRFFDYLSSDNLVAYEMIARWHNCFGLFIHRYEVFLFHIDGISRRYCIDVHIICVFRHQCSIYFEMRCYNFYTRIQARTYACTHGRTDARTHGRTDARTHGRTDARTHGRTDARTHGRTQSRTHAHTHTHHIRAHTRTHAHLVTSKKENMWLKLYKHPRRRSKISTTPCCQQINRSVSSNHNYHNSFYNEPLGQEFDLVQKRNLLGVCKHFRR